MRLGILLGLIDVEVPHYLFKPLLHLVDCEHETNNIGNWNVGITRWITVILGLPSEMGELPSLDDDLDIGLLRQIIGASLGQESLVIDSKR